MIATLPFPPPSNMLYPTGKYNGRRFLSERGKKAKAEIIDIIEKAINEQCFLYNDEKDIIISFWYYMPDKRRRDVHNLHKIICDSISEAIEIDDSNFLCRDMSKELDRENPRVEVKIWQE